MRQAAVFYKGEKAGMLMQLDDGSFRFRYDDLWMVNRDKPAISLTLPKVQQEFHSSHLFPFFFHLLPEGTNKEVVCTYNRIDVDDHFGLLLATATHDTVGAITLRETQSAA